MLIAGILYTSLGAAAIVAATLFCRRPGIGFWSNTPPWRLHEYYSAAGLFLSGVGVGLFAAGGALLQLYIWPA